MTRQMLGQGLAGGPLALERWDIGLRRRQGSYELIFGGSGFALLEGQFHLIQQMARALGTLAERGAAHLLVLQFEKGVVGLKVGGDHLVLSRIFGSFMVMWTS